MSYSLATGGVLFVLAASRRAHRAVGDRYVNTETQSNPTFA